MLLTSLALMFSILSADCVVSTETRLGKLDVVVVDLTGARLEGVEAELHAPDGHVVTKLDHVVYGDYELRVWTKGYQEARRDIRIYQPVTAVRVQVELGSIGCPTPPTAIAGRVLGGTGDMWVQAVPVYGSVGGADRVSRDGSFSISGLAYSEYLVILIRGSKVLQQRVVQTYPQGTEIRKIVFDVRANP